MENASTKTALVFLCLALATVLTGAPVVQDETPSVLDRVRTVEDPELGELIRAALENRQGTLELIRKVTLSYAQIKLLDQQIQEVSRKIEKIAGPAEMRYELLLAKAELEAKLTEKLADLREVMGVIPKYPFDEQPVEELHTRLYLNPIDEGRVYVLDTEDPTTEYWAMVDFTSLGLMSRDDALDLIRDRLRDPNNLPIRVDILWLDKLDKTAEALRDSVIRLVREMRAEMQAEVRLDRSQFHGSGEAPFFLRAGRITTFYPAPVKRPNEPAGNNLLVNGPVELDDLEKHILWRITFKWNLPLTFRIEYDRASFDLAQRITDTIRTITRRLNVTELVDVNSILVEPIPEEVFLGRWRAISRGEVREVTLQRGGQSELRMDKQPDGSGGPTVTPAPWYLTTEQIIIDLKRVYAKGHRYVYRGHINSEGNLVLDKGLIERRGSFGRSAVTQIVLEKVQ